MLKMETWVVGVCVYQFHLGFTTVSHVLGKTAI